MWFLAFLASCVAVACSAQYDKGNEFPCIPLEFQKTLYAKAELAENVDAEGRPLYQLLYEDQNNQGNTYEPYRKYTFYVVSNHEAFVNVLIQTEMNPENSSCDTGRLKGSHLLQDFDACPNVLINRDTQSKKKLVFRWIAPRCGCIKIKAAVVSDGGKTYKDGALTKYFCEISDENESPLGETDVFEVEVPDEPINPFEPSQDSYSLPPDTTTDPYGEPFDIYEEPLNPVDDPYGALTDPREDPYQELLYPTDDPYDEPLEPVGDPYVEPFGPGEDPYDEPLYPTYDPYEDPVKPVEDPYLGSYGEDTYDKPIDPTGDAYEDQFNRTGDPLEQPLEPTEKGLNKTSEPSQESETKKNEWLFKMMLKQRRQHRRHHGRRPHHGHRPHNKPGNPHHHHHHHPHHWAPMHYRSHHILDYPIRRPLAPDVYFMKWNRGQQTPINPVDDMEDPFDEDEDAEPIDEDQKSFGDVDLNYDRYEDDQYSHYPSTRFDTTFGDEEEEEEEEEEDMDRIPKLMRKRNLMKECCKSGYIYGKTLPRRPTFRACLSAGKRFVRTTKKQKLLCLKKFGACCMAADKKRESSATEIDRPTRLNKYPPTSMTTVDRTIVTDRVDGGFGKTEGNYTGDLWKICCEAGCTSGKRPDRGPLGNSCPRMGRLFVRTWKKPLQRKCFRKFKTCCLRCSSKRRHHPRKGHHHHRPRPGPRPRPHPRPTPQPHPNHVPKPTGSPHHPDRTPPSPWEPTETHQPIHGNHTKPNYLPTTSPAPPTELPVNKFLLVRDYLSDALTGRDLDDENEEDGKKRKDRLMKNRRKLNRMLRGQRKEEPRRHREE